MPESSSSEGSKLANENRDNLPALSPVTPFTAMSSSDVLNMDTSKQHRRHRTDSGVRFRDFSPLPLEELQSSSLPTSKVGFTPPLGKEDWTKSPLQPQQPYSELLQDRARLEDRVSMLEAKIQNLDPPRFADFSDRGDSSSERSGLSVEPQYQTWQEYLEPTTTRRATNIMEVLIERPHTNRKSSLVLNQPESAFESATATKSIERIRFRSLHIINALQQITEQTFPNSACFTIHRPFKILLFYEKAIENHLTELEESFSDAHCILGKQCNARIELDEVTTRLVESYHSPQSTGQRDRRHGPLMSPVTDEKDDKPAPGETLLERQSHAPSTVFGQQTFNMDDSDNSDCRHEVTDDLLAQGEAIMHLRALVKFMKEDMREIFRRHRLLRSSKAEMISFTDIWHLFMAGDLVVTNDESNQMIYRVSILPAGSPFSSRKPVKEIKMRSEGSHRHLESVYGQESMNVALIDVFYYNFDGRNFGPVEERLTIVSYDGMKKITDLPVYPLRFRSDAPTFKAKMLERGQKFRDLLTKPHWEYNGLSAAEPQEQIDSQVIIDIPLAYRKHPERAPKFGLKSWMEDSARIVTEACGVPGCTECFKESFMFDDHRIDRQRTVEFVKANESLLRTIKDIEELTNDLMLLLPNRAYGFVLRSRRWYYLDLDRIHQVHRQSEGFESLILPQGVARLVEGLVQTHGVRDENAVPIDELDSEHQFDLVRGKGKGLIILLHGAPGVGKTSTAECVADYTQKPLFPITCGDIGETAKEVEQNLEQNFSLAHRWDCVLLLDEADVFLQARDKEDMRRNSVVSVFLRVLEYYSGILFLTTNKVGHFDEAFKSRIHVSLYYPQLDEDSTIQIWKMNLRRLLENKKHIDVDSKAIKRFARKHYANLEKAKRGPWNGRQIKNAFQTAIALAEFDAKTNDLIKPELTVEHFQVVAKASEGFDEYLSRIHGTDMDRARREGQRDDERARPVLFPFPQKSSQKQSKSSSSSSSESSKEERKTKKAKSTTKHDKKKKSKSKAKVQASSSDEKTGSSTSEASEEREKRKPKDRKSTGRKSKEGGSSRSKSNLKNKQISDSDNTSAE